MYPVVAAGVWRPETEYPAEQSGTGRTLVVFHAETPVTGGGSPLVTSICSGNGGARQKQAGGSARLRGKQ